MKTAIVEETVLRIHFLFPRRETMNVSEAFPQQMLIARKQGNVVAEIFYLVLPISSKAY